MRRYQIIAPMMIKRDSSRQIRAHMMIKIKEKQKIKELEAEQNTIEDGKLVQEKKDKESINSKIVAEKNEFIDTISTTENSLIDKIETEGENPERDKKIIGEQDKIHKITKESLQNNKKSRTKS